MKSSVTLPKNFNKLLPLYQLTIQKGIEEVTSDLLRVAQQRAPEDTQTLVQSGDKKVSKTGIGCQGIVSFSATKQGFNYAEKMDTGSYKLGKKSLAKSGRGVKSKFAKSGMKVGKGYLSGTAKRCSTGYKKHLIELVGDVSKKLDFE